jgi:hypothetical protein
MRLLVEIRQDENGLSSLDATTDVKKIRGFFLRERYGAFSGRYFQRFSTKPSAYSTCVFKRVLKGLNHEIKFKLFDKN